jgi:predicted DNA-binding antitoxin AbrB/MazE fold protein
MSQTIRAIYENGILRPLEALSLADREHVRLTVEPDSSSTISSSVDNESADPLASLRVSTGISDLAENFDDYRFGKRHP